MSPTNKINLEEALILQLRPQWSTVRPCSDGIAKGHDAVNFSVVKRQFHQGINPTVCHLDSTCPICMYGVVRVHAIKTTILIYQDHLGISRAPAGNTLLQHCIVAGHLWMPRQSKRCQELSGNQEPTQQADLFRHGGKW